MTPRHLTVGVVTPHRAPGPEVELPAISGGRIVTVVSRTGNATDAPGTMPRSAHADLRASTEPTALERAAVTFRGNPLAVITHASTTTGYVIGHRAEADLTERLAARFGVPAVASCAAAVAALRVLGVTVVQLVHPPWFDDDFDELGAEYFGSQGFNTVVTRAVDLPDDPARVQPQHVIDVVERCVEQESEDADAVFLAGNGFRAAAAIEELERRTGRLVLTANQALMWGVLEATRTTWDITGYGRLLRATSPS
jgi:maleate isomerase